MITWFVRNAGIFDRRNSNSMMKVRAERRMDVMIAMDFLDTMRVVDREEDGFVNEPQKMFVRGLGYVDKEEYITVLENGLYND